MTFEPKPIVAAVENNALHLAAQIDRPRHLVRAAPARGRTGDPAAQAESVAVPSGGIAGAPRASPARGAKPTSRGIVRHRRHVGVNRTRPAPRRLAGNAILGFTLHRQLPPGLAALCGARHRPLVPPALPLQVGGPSLLHQTRPLNQAPAYDCRLPDGDATDQELQVIADTAVARLAIVRR